MERIEITFGINGYPKNVLEGYAYFENMQELEDFLAENPQYEPCHLYSKNGWHYWELKEYITASYYLEEYTLTAEDFGGSEFDPVEDGLYLQGEFEKNGRFDFAEEEGEYRLETLNNAIKQLQYYKEALEDYDTMDKEDEIMIIYNGDFNAREIIKKRCMDYCEDVHHYAIGCVLNPDYEYEKEL